MLEPNSPNEEHHSTRVSCQRCAKSFKSVITLRHHTEVCSNRNSEPRFTCEICQKKFRTDIQYTRHVYYTHAQRTFACAEEGCGRTFLSNSHLASHMITHTSDRPYPCPISGCTYRARTTGRLAQHKVIHGQGRRFSCDYCDYSATTSSNLRRHARIHAGARPYLCPHCSHRTSELDALKKHVLDSGRHPGLPLYVCHWCHSPDSSTGCVGFNASGLAWRHILTEHSGEIMKPETLNRIGRLSEKSVSERDVTRLLGIYCPEIDSTQPPENIAVRQPSVLSRHRRQKIQPSNHKQSTSLSHKILANETENSSDSRMDSNSEQMDAVCASDRPNSHILKTINHDRQLIHLHVGQAGVQTANALWELYCLEHQIQPDGRQVASAFDALQTRINAAKMMGLERLDVEDLDGKHISPAELNELKKTIPTADSTYTPALEQARDFDNGAYETLFEVSPHGQFVPRTVFVDSETSVIDEVRAGMYRCLYHPDDLITYNEDCSNNFARGNITVGRHLIEKVMDRIRKAVEHADLLQGIVATHSCSGGTGGGLSAYIFRCIASDYEKLSIVQLPVYPSPQFSNSIVEPYNTVLHMDQAVDVVKLSAMMDNEAIGDICYRNLMHRQPTFHTMNQVIALLSSSLISPVRYPGCLTAGLPELETNLVPFPRIHFPVLRHAPFLHFSKSGHQVSSINELVQSVFSTAGQTVKCDVNRGKFIACVLSFRGLVGPKLVNDALTRIKLTPHYDFVEWCPTGVKVNLVAQPPVFMAYDSHIAPSDFSVTMLANTTAIRSVWATVGAKFDMMFSRRCFVHWFVSEGMEEAEMVEARETLASIENDYREIGISGDQNWNYSNKQTDRNRFGRCGWRFKKNTLIPNSGIQYTGKSIDYEKELSSITLPSSIATTFSPPRVLKCR